MYRFILFYFVLYICIDIAPWSCEARRFVPLYVHTCSAMTIKLNCFVSYLLFCDVKSSCVDGQVCVSTESSSQSGSGLTSKDNIVYI